MSLSEKPLARELTPAEREKHDTLFKEYQLLTGKNHYMPIAKFATLLYAQIFAKDVMKNDNTWVDTNRYQQIAQDPKAPALAVEFGNREEESEGIWGVVFFGATGKG